jgi:hypothetical protein
LTRRTAASTDGCGSRWFGLGLGQNLVVTAMFCD